MLGEITAVKKRPKQRSLKEHREVAQQLQLLLLERKLVHSTCFRWLTAAYNPRPRVWFYKKKKINKSYLKTLKKLRDKHRSPFCRKCLKIKFLLLILYNC